MIIVATVFGGGGLMALLPAVPEILVPRRRGDHNLFRGTTVDPNDQDLTAWRAMVLHHSVCCEAPCKSQNNY
eukprot:6463438-Amphidinium_carterae.1